MRNNRKLEQHIAVFGESGSGKTVMLSSFYGAAQEPQNIKKSRFHVLAENPSQGTHLSQNYLGMKKSAQVPEANKFSAKSYSFLIKLKAGSDPKAKAKRFDALRLVWHDYPGEWFEQDVSGPEEAQRRVDTFRDLLRSDVALLLVDGQKLLDNAGAEERYLKSLFTDYCNGLLLLKDDLLPDGRRLVTFPRIWIMALSKSDLLPHLDVFEFRDLLLEKSRDDIEKLRDVLGGLLESNNALSLGEDFVLLSSAKFEANKIELSTRVGLDLILPMASVLAFERHIRWAQAGQVSRKVALDLLRNAEAVAVALDVFAGLVVKLIGKSNKAVAAIGLLLVSLGPSMTDALKRAEKKLKEADAEALAKQNDLAAILTGFQMDLAKGEEEQVFLRSP